MFDHDRCCCCFELRLLSLLSNLLPHQRVSASGSANYSRCSATCSSEAAPLPFALVRRGPVPSAVPTITALLVVFQPFQPTVISALPEFMDLAITQNLFESGITGRRCNLFVDGT
jgi:hypothetical protein